MTVRQVLDRELITGGGKSPRARILLSGRLGNRLNPLSVSDYRLIISIIIAGSLFLIPALHAATGSGSGNVASGCNVAAFHADGLHATATLNGVAPVPEPSESALIGLAFGIALVWTRAKARSRR
jgi:hypothetical protein